jgi:chromosome segregation ATPase
LIGDGERHLASLRTDLRVLEYRYAELIERLDDPEREEKIISSESTPEERAKLLAESKELTQEKEHVDGRIHHLEADIREEAILIDRLRAESQFM